MHGNASLLQSLLLLALEKISSICFSNLKYKARLHDSEYRERQEKVIVQHLLSTYYAQTAYLVWTAEDKLDSPRALPPRSLLTSRRLAKCKSWERWPPVLLQGLDPLCGQHDFPAACDFVTEISTTLKELPPPSLLEALTPDQQGKYFSNAFLGENLRSHAVPLGHSRNQKPTVCEELCWLWSLIDSLDHQGWIMIGWLCYVRDSYKWRGSTQTKFVCPPPLNAPKFQILFCLEARGHGDTCVAFSFLVFSESCDSDCLLLPERWTPAPCDILNGDIFLWESFETVQRAWLIQI